MELSNEVDEVEAIVHGDGPDGGESGDLGETPTVPSFHLP